MWVLASSQGCEEDQFETESDVIDYYYPSYTPAVYKSVTEEEGREMDNLPSNETMASAGQGGKVIESSHVGGSISNMVDDIFLLSPLQRIVVRKHRRSPLLTQRPRLSTHKDLRRCDR